MRTVLLPVSSVSSAVSTWTSDFFYGFTMARRLSVENRRLSERLAAVALYAETTSRLERDIDELRRQASMAPLPGRTKVAADILGFIPRENRLTLSVGTNQGIRPGMPVVSSAGLVGTIQTVSAQRSQVVFLTSRGLKIGAIVINRNPSPAGLLQGEGASTLALSFSDPKAPVQIGDTVATSGLSDRIPRGIPIGRVIQVVDDIAFGERRAEVDPFVSIGELRQVVVLK